MSFAHLACSWRGRPFQGQRTNNVNYLNENLLGPPHPPPPPSPPKNYIYIYTSLGRGGGLEGLHLRCVPSPGCWHVFRQFSLGVRWAVLRNSGRQKVWPLGGLPGNILGGSSGGPAWGGERGVLGIYWALPRRSGALLVPLSASWAALGALLAAPKSRVAEKLRIVGSTPAAPGKLWAAPSAPVGPSDVVLEVPRAPRPCTTAARHPQSPRVPNTPRVTKLCHQATAAPHPKSPRVTNSPRVTKPLQPRSPNPHVSPGPTATLHPEVPFVAGPRCIT